MHVRVACVFVFGGAPRGLRIAGGVLIDGLAIVVHALKNKSGL
jgi:hypothetical protein